MTDDDLDRIFSREEDIVPSSGFAGGVMDAVRNQASTPPPIPFPWRRAIPGLAAWALALGSLIALLARPGASAADRAVLANAMEAARTSGAGWIAVALLASLVSVMVSMRLTGGRS